MALFQFCALVRQKQNTTLAEPLMFCCHMDTVLPCEGIQPVIDGDVIRSDGTITQIATDTTPFSLEPVPSVLPVRFVLEVNAGTAKRLGLKPGDRLVHPRAAPR